ncbi:hypothetical protein [Magnetospirillum sp. LM-5]|uniref:hypothetical protein n=1 Tax=Magnetospirillum sp. LM-5 TaxID=2681466 RepID=UPI00156F2340|nr:hypothetical protein [Magnetospirillum sp. LM-5]
MTEGNDAIWIGNVQSVEKIEAGAVNDTFIGGAGSGWADTQDLSDAVGQDVAGEVHLTTAHGETVVDFDNLEQIKW